MCCSISCDICYGFKGWIFHVAFNSYHGNKRLFLHIEAEEIKGNQNLPANLSLIIRFSLNKLPETQIAEVTIPDVTENPNILRCSLLVANSITVTIETSLYCSSVIDFLQRIVKNAYK